MCQSDQIRRIAQLAHLSLPEEDLASLARDFQQISSLFEQIVNASVPEVPWKEGQLDLRPDVATKPRVARLLTGSFTDGLFVTPAAIKDDES
ncbi:MAG: aspartyl/glutamyl-tRNA amidotransferase subunit C [Proteobacteria bacterium]|nr:aspartyl/glutamyl-tRNA amidotransferase subunit C [Pseudomonadota bacterium]